VLNRREMADLDREFLGIIVEEVDRLNGVVGQFLDYARPMKVHGMDMQPDTLIQGVMALVVAEGLPSGVHVDYEPGVDVPSAEMDIEKLKQVMINVLRNGLEAMSDGGGTLTIRTRVGVRGSAGPGVTSLRTLAPRAMVRVRRGGLQTVRFVEFSFTDEGEGITEEDARKLFIPFFTTKASGTGLGLPICERIMRAHGGEIEIQSRVGRGTSFALRLPLPDAVSTEDKIDALTTIEDLRALRGGETQERRTTSPAAHFPIDE
jgi:two-component system, NtrC family, sensor histidine kinase HydH